MSIRHRVVYVWAGEPTRLLVKDDKQPVVTRIAVQSKHEMFEQR